jgi:hypothetical protein
MELAKAKLVPSVAARVGLRWFKQESDGSAEALLEVIKGLPKGPLVDSVIGGAVAELKRATPAQARQLVASLSGEQAVMVSTPTIIGRVDGLTGAQLNAIVQALSLGLWRDTVISRTLGALRAVTPTEARDLIRSAYAPEVRQAVASALFGKISRLDSDKIQLVALAAVRSSLRDMILVEGLKALPTTSSIAASGLIELIGMTSSATAERQVVEAALPRITDLNADTVLAITRAMTPGAERDACSARMNAAMTALLRP